MSNFQEASKFTNVSMRCKVKLEEGKVKVGAINVSAPEQMQTSLSQSVRKSELLVRRHKVSQEHPPAIDFNTKLKLKVQKYT